MAPAGRVLLILALLCAVYGVGASLYGARTGARVWVDSARRTMYSLCGIAATAFVILDIAFVSNDFSYTIVASGSSTTTPFFYRIAAVWATPKLATPLELPPVPLIDIAPPAAVSVAPV